MSRSFKKTPRCGQQKDKFYKKYANRKVRRRSIEEPSLNKMAYKKVFCCYDICDYEIVGVTFQEHWKRLLKRFPKITKEEAYKSYLRWYIRK